MKSVEFEVETRDSAESHIMIADIAKIVLEVRSDHVKGEYNYGVWVLGVGRFEISDTTYIKLEKALKGDDLISSSHLERTGSGDFRVVRDYIRPGSER